MRRIAVVSGGNRGIGLEICRQLARRGIHVVLASRDERRGSAAAKALAEQGLSVEPRRLDVADDASVEELARGIEAEHGGADIVVNNAGVAMDGFDAEVARATIDVNFFGALRLTDALLPRMRPEGRIVMVTSGLGDRRSLSRPLKAQVGKADLTRDELLRLMHKFVDDVAAGRHAAEGWPTSAYAVSKMGINALTGVVARELAQDGRGILCNAACPGWVRTDMGGAHAPRSVEEGAETPVWLATLPPGGPQGGVFRDKAPAAW
ncbi:short-chain dehydrogenase [Sorangium cellulosum]|uniref:Short-chain dehydrogenase n=1 Tax=Sorangium cellulosum TaxID=56 RepID=A0A2L0ERF1_SORCE|nr:SDR family oxidoreductase [Sorangium cellulosum]AUX41855.1 short-chain dehydrogenase [Sorangium cellulosum]